LDQVVFADEQEGQKVFESAFRQKEVTDVIGKYRQKDEDHAARISFLLGGIVRHLSSKSKKPQEIEDAVKFAAQTTMLGEARSGDAIASAVAMYVISGGSLEENNHFKRSVYFMGESVRKDSIKPQETKDLGISQVARLTAFESLIQEKEPETFPDLSPYYEAFEGFPTVGAEFHFPVSTVQDDPGFWDRLMILNMSQYQRGSYIQLSRNDRNIIEIRMNPSIYPVTIANWQHMKLLLPELGQAFFTATINRTTSSDFSWGTDKEVLNKLKAIGMLSYANTFETIPRKGKAEEINFGEVYLGQTVKMKEGTYKFTGNWISGESGNGQMAIYTGFGPNFPDLMYYPTMVLADPNIVGSKMKSFLDKIKSLDYALAVSPINRKDVFETLQRRVYLEPGLHEAFHAGRKITGDLAP